MHRNSNDITEGVIWKGMLRFFFPILLGTFFQQMYNTADAIIVGNFVGTQGLAAVGGGTSSLINFLLAIFNGLSSGCTVVLSQRYGARDLNGITETVHTSAAVALGGGALLTAIGVSMSPVMLMWMGSPEDVIGLASIYTRIYFGGMIPSMVYNIGSGLLRAVGDSKRPLYFLIASCLTNIVMDLLCVAVLNMGVAGAALATVFSQVISAVLVSATLIRTRESYRLIPRNIHLNPRLFGAIVRIGLPAGLQSIMYSFSNVIIQSAVNTFGSVVVAAYTAYQKLDGLFWMVINAFGSTVTTFVGQNFGAAHYKRMKRCINIGLLMTTIGTVLVSVGLVTAGRPLLRLFTQDSEVLYYGQLLLNRLAPFYFTYIMCEVFAAALRGCGDVTIPTVMTMLGICGTRMLWILFVLPGSHTLSTLVTCYPLSWGAASVFFLIYYYRSGWLKRRLKVLGLEQA